MKKIKSIFVFLMAVFFIESSNGQSPSGYHYNQAKAFNEYIGEASGSWKFVAPKTWDVQKITFTRVSLGRKDLQGNELYRYEFKLKNGREMSIVPDNHFYPITYALLIKYNNGREYRDNYNESLTDYKYIALGSGYIANARFNVGGPLAPEDKYDRIVCYPYLANLSTGDAEVGQFVKGSGKGTPFSSWRDFIKAEGYKYTQSVSFNDGRTNGYEYKGLNEFYEYLKKYIDKATEEIKTLGYDKMINKFEEGEYHYYGKPIKFSSEAEVLPGPVRIKFETDKGRRVKMIVQNSFDDGKFYDKEKFFVSFPLGFKSGSFDKSIIAFDDMLMAGYSYQGTFIVYGIFSKRPFDYAAFNLVREDGKRGFWALGITSERYFCLTELESEYNAEKDPISTINIWKRIYKAYAGK